MVDPSWFPLAVLSTDWGKYAGHFAIDVLATLATLYAQRLVDRPAYKFLVWLALSVVVTVSTVNLID